MGCDPAFCACVNPAQPPPCLTPQDMISHSSSERPAPKEINGNALL